MDKELARYLSIVRNFKNGRTSPEDIEFFVEYSPKIDKAKIQKAIDAGEYASPQAFRDALLETGKQLQSSPEYKEFQLEIAKKAEKGRISDDFLKGANLVLAGTDIAASIAQIQESNKALRRSKKPTRPLAPGRDPYLAQALRQAQEGTNDAARALAPAQAQIQDQYQNDIANAKTASAGQAGAYGAYGQLAANRRNRAAMDLAPIADQVRQGQQARQDALTGMRMDETQQMFQNNAMFYPTELNQYNNEQEAAAMLGSQGRSNLRNSLYNFGNQAGPAFAHYATERKYRNLRNRAAAAYGPDVADIMVRADQGVNDQWKIAFPEMGSQYDAINPYGDSPSLNQTRNQYRRPWNS